MHKFWASLGYKMVPYLRERRGKDREGVGGKEGEKGGERTKRRGKEKREMQRGKKRREGGRESPSPILQTGFYHITSSSELKPKG